MPGDQIHPEQTLRLPLNECLDKTTKSPKKVSTYLGRLTKEAGLIPKGSRGSRPLHSFRTVREYGNAALMTEEFTDLLR